MKQSSANKPQINALAGEAGALLPKIIAIELWRNIRQYSAQSPSNLTLIHSTSVSSWLLLLAEIEKKKIHLLVNPAISAVPFPVANLITGDKNVWSDNYADQKNDACAPLFLFSHQVVSTQMQKVFSELVIMCFLSFSEYRNSFFF